MPYLLGLLEKKLGGNESAVKAQIVQVLKAMCLSLQHGTQVFFFMKYIILQNYS